MLRWRGAASLASPALAAACGLLLLGCRNESRTSTTPPTRPTPSVALGPASSAPPPTTAQLADAGLHATSGARCASVGAGEISDDETPTVRGATKRSEMLPWFEARGLTKSAVLAFFARHWGRGISPTDAETYFGYGSCDALTVGDKAEPALLCVQGVPEGLVAAHALVVVVRSKRPVVVLDVGVNLVALDWPDARWLDLALNIKDDGSTVELHDRAPDGARLVAPRSACVEREAELDACETEFANETNPERFAHASPSGESFDFFRPGCPITRGPDKKLRVHRAPMVAGFSPYPATIHDCAGGRARLVEAGRESGSATDRAEWRRSIAFFDKSCGQRGAWKWRGDRFAKQP